MYEEHGENHDRPVFHKRIEQPPEAEPHQQEVFVYYWDNREGEDLCGCWFGAQVGGEEVWARMVCEDADPPERGWQLIAKGDTDLELVVASRMLERGRRRRRRHHRHRQDATPGDAAGEDMDEQLDDIGRAKHGLVGNALADMLVMDAAAMQLRGLPFDATETQIREFLGEHAEQLVEDESAVKFLLRARTNKPSGWARLQFNTPEAAEAAIAKCHMQNMGGESVEAFLNTSPEWKEWPGEAAPPQPSHPWVLLANEDSFYYHNEETGESSWSLPVSDAPAESEPAGEGGERDPKRQKTNSGADQGVGRSRSRRRRRGRRGEGQPDKGQPPPPGPPGYAPWGPFPVGPPPPGYAPLPPGGRPPAGYPVPHFMGAPHMRPPWMMGGYPPAPWGPPPPGHHWPGAPMPPPADGGRKA